MDDLQWLGLQWDGEPQYQSRRHDIYAKALSRLSVLGLVYPCRCTRADPLTPQARHLSPEHAGTRCCIYIRDTAHDGTAIP